MSADPVVVLGVLMAFLRRTTNLGRVLVGDLYEPAELVDRLLRCLGVESEADRLADLLLAAIAATPNAQAVAATHTRTAGERCYRCQHGTGPGQCEVCPILDQVEIRHPRAELRSRVRNPERRHDSRRPAGRSR